MKKEIFPNEKFKNKDKANITSKYFQKNLFKKFKITKCITRRKAYISKTKSNQFIDCKHKIKYKNHWHFVNFKYKNNILSFNENKQPKS